MEYICEICNKQYGSRQSRWNHIKKYHKKSNDLVVNSVVDFECTVVKNVVVNDNMCTLCKKELSDRTSRWRHEKICKNKDRPTDEAFIELKNQINEIKNNQIVEMEKFKKECMKAMKIHPKTLQKINKQLNNYGTINNFNIIALGKEKLEDVLTDKQKINILKSCNEAPSKLTNLIYSNPELEKFRNIYITNLSNDIGYVFDDDKKQYIVKPKSQIINQYSNERVWDIESFYDELKDKLDELTIKKIETLIKNYFNCDDTKNKIKKELLISLYNNKVNVKEIYEKVNEIEL
jgi:hypothetical protein